MALNHTNSTTTKTSMYSKLALGAASFVILAAVGSTTIAGATEGQTKEANSSHAQSEQGKNRGQSGNEHSNKNHDKDKSNNGKGHGYGGGNGNDIKTNLEINQSGNDNVLTVIINYIFG